MVVITDVIEETKKEPFTRGNGLWTLNLEEDENVEDSFNNLRILEGRGTFQKTFVQNCAGSGASQIILKEIKVKDPIYSRNIGKNLCDFECMTNRQMVKIAISIFAGAEDHRAYYLRHKNLVTSMVTTQHLSRNFLSTYRLPNPHILNFLTVPEIYVIPTGAIVLELVIQN